MEGEYYRALYQRQDGRWQLFVYCACHERYPGGMGPVTIDQLLADGTPEAPIREARYPRREAIPFELPEAALLEPGKPSAKPRKPA